MTNDQCPRRKKLALALVLVPIFIVLPSPLPASDWPQILGPDRNGAYTGTDLAATWPAGGPKTIWKMQIGDGFSGPAVADGKVILFHRIGNNEVVQALDAESGRPLWKHEYPTAYRDDFGFDPGPRAVPTVAGGTVFTYGADGMLSALELATGAKRWQRDCKADFGAAKGFFGRACSPLVEEGLVILNIGGSGDSAFVAFDTAKGATRWKSLPDEPGYSSPVAATLDGRRTVVAVSRSQFAVLDAVTGKAIATMPFSPPVSASVTGALPLVSGGEMFVSAAYDLGARLLRVDGRSFATVWQGDGQLSLQYSSAVLRNGFLYGLHGRHDFPGGTELRCVEWATGNVRWSKPGLSGANVLLAGDSLLVLTEKGELIRAEAKPDGYRELARAQILGLGTRAYPALANGRFYARDKRQLVCIELR